MAFKDYIGVTEQWSNVSASSNTMSVSATAGNLIVLSILLDNSNTTTSPAVTGYTTLFWSGTGSGWSWAVLGRIATGDSSDNVSASWTANNTNQFVAVEYEGPWDALPDVSVTPGSDVSNRGTGVTSTGTGTATALEDTGLAVSLLVVKDHGQWATSLDDSAGKITQPSGFTKHFYDGTQAGKPGTSVASKSLSASGAQSGTWSTSEVSTDEVMAAMFVFENASAAVDNPDWSNNDNGDVTFDQEGLGGVANSATLLSATSANFKVTGKEVTLDSDTHTARFWVKRVTGTGTINITLDNWATSVDVTTQLSGGTPNTDYNDFIEVIADQTLANPQIGIEVVTSGDEIIVGNAELVFGFPEEEVTGAPPIVAVDTASYIFTETAVDQVGEWTASVTWNTYGDNTLYYKMDDGAATLVAQNGEGTAVPAENATINSHDVGRWT
jgi:hypothetical protein